MKTPYCKGCNYLLIPAAHTLPPPLPIALEKKHPRIHPSGVKILTVDDSKAIRLLVKKTFQGYDCEVLEAGDGKEAIDMVQQEKPDLIVMDITMPEMSGTEALKILRSMEVSRQTPVIMLTAMASPQVAMEVALLGVNDVIPKPFDREVLLHKAMRLIPLHGKT